VATYLATLSPRLHVGSYAAPLLHLTGGRELCELLLPMSGIYVTK
jgi:hypothetical protein